MLQVLKSQLGDSMKSVRSFLQKPIRLDEGGLSLGASAKSQRDRAREERHLRVRRIRRDLYDLLGQHPSSRRLMRHLAAVERTLQTGGLRGFEALPVRVIARALAEMDSLVRDWSPVGLAELRSRMAVIVKTRPQESASMPLDSLPESNHGPVSVHAGFSASLPADVTEVDHAEFEEMERSWVGVVPTANAAPAVKA
ncbi:MAG: hypothetical protein ABI702_20890 [Burkholderiales bacterium]